MLVHGLALIGIVLFALGLGWLGVVAAAQEALRVSREATETVTRRDADDDQKEAAARRAAVALLGGFVSILIRAMGAVLLSALPALGAHLLGFARIEDVAAKLTTAPYLVAGFLSLGLLFVGGRKGAKAAAGPDAEQPHAAAGAESPAPSLEQSYSPLERQIHQIAFSGPGVQLMAASIGKALHGSRYKDIPLHEPVFITSLPRAGTTLLLDIVTKMSGFASHTYRDMPFVMAPLLWNSVSAHFRKSANLVGRAHGDGMLVGYDSPEAFEEVIWRALWPEKFLADRIALWSEQEDTDEFAPFMSDQMRQVIALRSGGAGGARYVSKNNANVSRIDFLKRLFPDSIILVPFRHPFAQAASLLSQHRRFLEVHRKEAFSRRYMDDIGHLEFGALHRPLDFPGMEEVRGKHSLDSLGYWVGYWVTAFDHVLARCDKVILMSYEQSCANGAAALQALAGALHVDQAALASLDGDVFRGPRSYEDRADVDPELRERALDTYRRLLDKSIT